MGKLKRYLIPLVTAAILLLCIDVRSQQVVPPAGAIPNYVLPAICGNETILHKLRQDKNFKAREDKMNRDIQRFLRPTADTITLPVVIHIINPNAASISDQQVINGINDLNDAFSKSGIYSGSAGVDTRIRFCIAKKDPDGGITTGITRTDSYFGTDLNVDNEDAKLKDQIQWDPNRYINIWLVTNIYGESYANYSCGVWVRMGLSGYATPPPGGHSLDGIVVTGFGELLAHEMGHYLGLYHTFTGGCTNNNCLLDGDQVCDTPPDGSVFSSGTCGSPGNSCNTDTLSNYSNGIFFTDMPDQVSNFMDYGNSGCGNQFTQGQADRMHAAVNTQRIGLLQNACTPPCPGSMRAMFTRDTAYTAAGETVVFTNTSIGASNFRWLVNDVLQSTGTNFTWKFDAAGKYKISLKAFNADSTCFGANTGYVLVNCGVTARFFADKKTIASIMPLYPDSIIFTNTSFRGAKYEWLVGHDDGMQEQVVSTDKDLVYIFPVPANYTIRLVAINGGCRDTTSFFNVAVQDPTADGVPLLYNAYCFQQTKVKLSLCISNFGFAPLPAGTPVTFYDADPRLPGANKLSPTFYLPYQADGGNCTYCFYDHVLDIPYAGLNQVYAVFNDSGNVAPLVLPNRSLPEKNYSNNVTSISNIRFKVTPTPASATLLPGDTLQLLAQASPAPFPGATFLWSDAYRLSCTACSDPLLYADSDRVKRVIAYSEFGCIDTAYVTIKVPPANDYTIKLNDVVCVSQNSLAVNFTLFNSFMRGVIPKGLKVSFYQGDPNTTSAVLLPPVFSVADTVFALQATFNTSIKILPEGTLYAVVNDSSVSVPVILPNTAKLEKDYTNNFSSIQFIPNKKTMDTVICPGTGYDGYTIAGTYIDTLKGYNGCDSIRTLNLRLHPKPQPNLGADRGICRGGDYTLHPGNYTSYLWQNGDTTATFTTSTPGAYFVQVSDNFNCLAADTILLNGILDLPKDFLPADTSLCAGNILSVNVAGFKNYLWSTGSNTSFTGITQNGTYRLQVTDQFDCVGSDSMQVSFIPDCIIIGIPKAFTPNSDGLNETFKPIIYAPVTNYIFQVYNRFGQLIFESNNTAKGWDGTFKGDLQDPATYVYHVSFKDFNGQNIKRSGSVVLIR